MKKFFCADIERRIKINLRRAVLVTSTKAITETKIVTKKRKGQEIHKTKRRVIIGYNKFMGGVDESDILLYTHILMEEVR